MAATATKKQQQPAAATTVDPKFEWAEKAGSYVLRLPLSGFRKDDFRVQVDGAGRLTVRGSRPAATGQNSLYKVFQLPSNASLDGIAGRFEAGVLTLTVPKRVSSGGNAGAVPTSIEEVKRKQSGVATKKAGPQQKKQEEQEAMSSKQEQQIPAPATAKKEENVKPKAPRVAAASPPEKPALLKPEAASTDKAKAAIAPESLAERVKRRSEEERANAPPMTAAKRAKTDGEKKATAAWGDWKERVQGELKVLTDMKWADGMVEAARKNKEVVAVGIAAFSLGFLVSHRLFRK